MHCTPASAFRVHVPATVLFVHSKSSKAKIKSLHKWRNKLFVKISNSSQILLRVQTMKTSEKFKKMFECFLPWNPPTFKNVMLFSCTCKWPQISLLFCRPAIQGAHFIIRSHYVQLFLILSSMSQWPRGPGLGSWVRIPPGAWTFVCCECCVCCQVEVSVTSWPLVQGNPTDCGASLCVTSKPHEWGARIKQAERLGDACSI